MRYTVVDNRTGAVICIDATSSETMGAMGIRSKASFYATVSRVRSGENRRWTIKSTGEKSYTVYDNRTDFPVCIDATAHEAMQSMGITTLNSFYSVISKARSGKSKRWTVVEEEDPVEV